MRQWTTVAMAFAVAGTLMACGSGGHLFGGGRAEVVRSAHPATAAPTQAPPVVVPSKTLERQRTLPQGTLQQEARLLRAEPTEVCFDVTLRGLDPRFADLRNWTPYARTSTGGTLDVTTTEEGPVTTDSLNGLVPVDVPAGSETYCAETDQYERCTRWRQRPVTRTEWHEGEVRVSTGGGVVCFEGDETITGETVAIAFRLNAGRTLGDVTSSFLPASRRAGPGRITFQWDIQGVRNAGGAAE